MDYGMIGTLLGCKVIVSQYCYKTVAKVKGFADVRKPSSKRPYYYKTVEHVPMCYMAGGNVICAPEIAEQIKQLERKAEHDIFASMDRAIREETAKAFGLPPALLVPDPAAQTLTLAKMQQAEMRARLLGPSPVEEISPLLRYRWGLGGIMPGYGFNPDTNTST